MLHLQTTSQARRIGPRQTLRRPRRTRHTLPPRRQRSRGGPAVRTSRDALARRWRLPQPLLRPQHRAADEACLLHQRQPTPRRACEAKGGQAAATQTPRTSLTTRVRSSGTTTPQRVLPTSCWRCPTHARRPMLKQAAVPSPLKTPELRLQRSWQSTTQTTGRRFRLGRHRPDGGAGRRCQPSTWTQPSRRRRLRSA